MRRGPSLFRGSELPRLLVLTGVMVAGWVLVWQFSGSRPGPVEPAVVVDGKPRPVVPDRSIEFETVTDRTPMSLRDNAAYARLLERARSKTPAELAKESRRDILLTHLWERPELYRGVPVHLEGTALRVLRYESKLSDTGWLYEAWINLPDVRRVPYVCVFEHPPRGFPIGSNVSERVVFDGYFLKIMKYEAADVTRGAPMLVGRIGFPQQVSQGPGSGSTLRWGLILLGVMFCISLVRWMVQLGRLFGRRESATALRPAPSDEIDPTELDRWVQTVSAEKDETAGPFWDPDEPRPGERADETASPVHSGPGPARHGTAEDEPSEAGALAGRPEMPGPGNASGPAGSGARPSDEAQSTSLPATGG